MIAHFCPRCGFRILPNEHIWKDGHCTTCVNSELQAAINTAQQKALPVVDVEEIICEDIELCLVTC
jgi:hypothetical protein